MHGVLFQKHQKFQDGNSRTRHKPRGQPQTSGFNAHTHPMAHLSPESLHNLYYNVTVYFKLHGSKDVFLEAKDFVL